jgi:hypothetical protein
MHHQYNYASQNTSKATSALQSEQRSGGHHVTACNGAYAPLHASGQQERHQIGRLNHVESYHSTKPPRMPLYTKVENTCIHECIESTLLLHPLSHACTEVQPPAGQAIPHGCPNCCTPIESRKSVHCCLPCPTTLYHTRGPSYQSIHHPIPSTTQKNVPQINSCLATSCHHPHVTH